MPTRIEIDKFPGNIEVNLGVLTANVVVQKTDTLLKKEIHKLTNHIMTDYGLKDIHDIKTIRDSRLFYKNIGQDPSRYRVSSEALYRRIVTGKGLYFINNVVEINNIISLKSGFSVGCYDLDKIEGPVVFRIGNRNEQYKGIGKDVFSVQKLPVFSDSKGAFGSPTSDSMRTMITQQTRNIMLVIISFSGQDKINHFLHEAKTHFTKWAQGSNFNENIQA